MYQVTECQLIFLNKRIFYCIVCKVRPTFSSLQTDTLTVGTLSRLIEGLHSGQVTRIKEKSLDSTDGFFPSEHLLYSAKCKQKIHTLATDIRYKNKLICWGYILLGRSQTPLSLAGSDHALFGSNCPIRFVPADTHTSLTPNKITQSLSWTQLLYFFRT